MTIRVLLADDQALVRGGFRSILDGQPDIEVVARRPTAWRPSSWRRATCDPTSS